MTNTVTMGRSIIKSGYPKLDLPTHRRLAAAIEGLAEVPPAGDIRPVTGQTGAYRLRVGIDHQQEVIFVDAIGSRGDIYK